MSAPQQVCSPWDRFLEMKVVLESWKDVKIKEAVVQVGGQREWETPPRDSPPPSLVPCAVPHAHISPPPVQCSPGVRHRCVLWGDKFIWGWGSAPLRPGLKSCLSLTEGARGTIPREVGLLQGLQAGGGRCWGHSQECLPPPPPLAF